jgi:hypothetical protein
MRPRRVATKNIAASVGWDYFHALRGGPSGEIAGRPRAREGRCRCASSPPRRFGSALEAAARARYVDSPSFLPSTSPCTTTTARLSDSTSDATACGRRSGAGADTCRKIKGVRRALSRGASARGTTCTRHRCTGHGRRGSVLAMLFSTSCRPTPRYVATYCSQVATSGLARRKESVVVAASDNIIAPGYSRAVAAPTGRASVIPGVARSVAQTTCGFADGRPLGCPSINSASPPSAAETSYGLVDAATRSPDPRAAAATAGW